MGVHFRTVLKEGKYEKEIKILASEVANQPSPQIKVVCFLTTMLKPSSIISVYVLFLFVFCSASSADDVLTIGVRTINGKESAILKWKETEKYLTRTLKGYQFKLIPVEDIDDLAIRTGNKEFDFILTIPSSYIEIEHKYSASRILTLENKRDNQPYTVFGSVIFTLKDRSDINTIADLKNKRLEIISPRGFGGWLIAWGEMLEHNFDPYEELKEFVVSKKASQLDVIEAVIARKVDAGVVRTDMLERMHKAGKIDINKIKIINPKETKSFPFAHSTRLYPEWAFAKAAHIPNRLAQKVAIALLQIEPDNIAATSGKYVGWTVPLSYEPVHQLLKKLRVTPYEDYGKLDLDQAVDVYKYELLVFLTLFSLTLLMVIYFFRKNRNLNYKRGKVLEEKRKLEKEIDERNTNITLLKSIGLAQSSYLNTENEKLAFDEILKGLLKITDADYVSIVEVISDNPIRYRSNSKLINTKKCFNKETSKNCFDLQEIKFLFNAAIKSEKAEVIETDAEKISLLYEAKPDMASNPEMIKIKIAAIPIIVDHRVVSVICLSHSNDLDLISHLDQLSPLFSSCANLISLFSEKHAADLNESALRQNELEQRSILESMSDVMVITDKAGNITKSNSAISTLFGYSIEEIKNCSINLLLEDYSKCIEDFNIYQNMQEDHTFSQAINSETMGFRQDGSCFPVHLSISKLEIDHKNFYTCIIRDISDLKKSDKLKRDKAAAELANKSKTEFLANMSHELRTPLHAILSFSKLGLRRVCNNEFEFSEKYFKNINLSGERLIKLINNILDLSSAEINHIDLNYTNEDMNKLLTLCIDELKPLASTNGITLKLICEPENFDIECDALRIHQIFTNIISNAINYSPEDTNIDIEIFHTSLNVGNENIDAIGVNVLDEGIGIPSGEEESIFDKFIQSSKTKTKAGGTGLGLSICKEFVDLHNGTLRAANRDGQGAQFEIILPVKKISK